MAPAESRLADALRQARDLLDTLGRRWALVGGLAVSVRAEPRFTRDIDLALASRDDPDAEELVRQFQSHGYRALEVLEHKGVGRLATARFVPPGQNEHGNLVDLLFASSGIENEIAARAARIEVFPRLEVPVASAADLLAMKILSRDDRERPQDAVDIRSLLGAADLDATRRALAAITDRGFHRHKDLAAELERVLSC